MDEQILEVLALAPGPQTDAEICEALRRCGEKAERFRVIERLRRLQEDGFVRLEGVRWHVLRLPPELEVTVKSDAVGAVVRSHRGLRTTHALTSTEVFPLSSVTRQRSVGSRWALFRRLCRYYMDCLIQDEAPQLKAFIGNEDDTWILLREVPWFRLAAGGDFAVSLALEQQALQRNRVRRGMQESLYLGYPLEFVKPAGSAGFLVPLFAQAVEAEWSGGVLHLTVGGPIAVNGAWLDHHFRRRVEREEFLRAMGFLSEVDDGDQAERRVGPNARDFGRLAQVAACYLHRADRFAEKIRPFVLSRMVDWPNAKPGLYNVAVLMLGPRFQYTRGLLRDLREIVEELTDEDLDQTALAKVFPHDPSQRESAEACPGRSQGSRSQEQLLKTAVAGAEEGACSEPCSPQPPALGPEDLAQTRLLHPAQRAAVRSAMEAKVSIVTGPPGTGKSEVVVAMLLNQMLRGRPTLFASKNHQAVEAVVPRLNGVVEGGELVVQTSSRDPASRGNYLLKLQDLLARPPRPDSELGEELREKLYAAFELQRRALEQVRMLLEAKDMYENLAEQFEKARTELPRSLQTDEALQRWPWEASVQRIDELASALREALRPPRNLFERLCRRLRPRRMQARRRAIRELLLGLPNPFDDRFWPAEGEPVEAWNDFFRVWYWWAQAASLADALRERERQLAQLPSREECDGQVAEAQQLIETRTREWAAWAAGGLANPLSPGDREALANLRAGIQNWGPDRFARELRQHFPLILRAFPLWSVSNLSARRALPLVPGLFDLVVVDEASQCDIASVVPLLARSRRAVFVGDPMQLRHVSNLEPVVEQSLLEEYELTDAGVQRFTYRVNSAFDLADATPSVPDSCRVRLDLHFRSHDLIADYCNEAFYSKALHVVTLTERLKIPCGRRPGIHWTHVVGKLQPGRTGAWCGEEVEAIHQELLFLVKGGYRGTVGVVTPFRQQMIRLKDALEGDGSLPGDFRERARFLVATAHGFQGDERDLILFSLCGGPDLPDGAAVFLRENPNLFNVAVSRARAVLHVVGNRDWALACGIPFIERLAWRALQGDIARLPQGSGPFQSPWEEILAEALQHVGVNVVPQHPVAGRFLDLAVLSPRKIDIEVDGESVHRTAGGGRRDDDHWRDLQLQSLGWQVCRFWVYELREDLDKCVRKVARMLES